MIHPETIKLITYTAYLNNMKLQKSNLTNEGEEVVYKPTSVELLKIGIDVNNISLEETLAKAFKKWIEKITGQ
jgi:LEA14-like dessication related protein